MIKKKAEIRVNGNFIYNIFMQLFFYAFTLWLGAYLLARNTQKEALRLTGRGLPAYALALAVQIIFDQFIFMSSDCLGA